MGTLGFKMFFRFFSGYFGQVLDLLAEIGTKEVVKNGKFTLPGRSSWCQSQEIYGNLVSSCFDDPFWQENLWYLRPSRNPAVDGKFQNRNNAWHFDLLPNQSDMVHRQNPGLVKFVLMHCSSIVLKIWGFLLTSPAHAKYVSQVFNARFGGLAMIKTRKKKATKGGLDIFRDTIQLSSGWDAFW